MKPHEKVGQYELLNAIRAGGIKEVWEAVHESGAKACLKLVRLDDRTSLAWRKTEEHGAAKQRLAAAVDSRVARVIETFEFGRFFVVAQEFVAGSDLRRQIQRLGSIPWRTAVTIAIEVLDSIARWRRADPHFSHNDLTIDNIRLSDSGKVRILDFGIAKSARCEDGTGQPFRTLLYCPQERIQGNKVCDGHTDTYSLAVSLYVCVSGGAHPFVEDGEGGLIFTPRPLPIPGCPAVLFEILSKELSLKPANRYQTPEEFRRDLEGALAGRPTLASRHVHSAATVQVPEPPATTELVPEPGTRVPLYSRLHGRARNLVVGGAMAAALIAVTAGLAPWRSQHRSFNDELTSLTSDWNVAPSKSVFPVKFLPNGDLTGRTKNLARQALVDYRNDRPRMTKPLWEQTSTLLARIPNPDAEARFQLAMVRGHVDRIQGRFRSAARNFSDAAALMPNSPDPAIALSRLAGVDLARLQALQKEAASKGHPPGQREMAQLGDACGAEAAKTKDPAQKLELLTRARVAYAGAAGYGEADQRRAKVEEEISQCKQALANAKP